MNHNITRTLAYFTSDGTYGSAKDTEFAVIDVTDWSAQDWERIDSCHDNERMELALVMADFKSAQLKLDF